MFIWEAFCLDFKIPHEFCIPQIAMKKLNRDRQKILVIDDNVNSVADPEEMIRIVGTEEIELLIADSKISKLNGQEFLNELRKLSPESAVIEMKSVSAADVCFNQEYQGTSNYLPKTVQQHTTREADKNVLEKQDVLKEISGFKTLVNVVLTEISSEKAIVFYSDEETKHLLDLEILFLGSMKSLAKILEERDKYTHGHSQRVSEIAVRIGKKMGLADKRLDNLSYSGILHDIGKIGIRDDILLKPGPLTKDEYEIIKTHPEKGYHILKPIEKLSEVCDVVYAHHEWYNGNGYPRNLKKDEIPYAASIISVADAYDSITSDRIYRRRRSHKEAVEILRECAGTQFHPDIVDVFLSMDKEN